MVLDDVADRARRIVKSTTALNAKILRHRDLNAFDVGAIPERFQERVLKTKENHVMDGPLPQVMINAKDRRLVECGQQYLIELACRRQIVPEGLFDDDPSVIGAARLGELLNYRFEQRGRNREVMRRP